MPRTSRPDPPVAPAADPPPGEEPTPFPLPVLPMADPRSAGAGNEPAVASVEPPVAPRHVERGVVVFDLDGTLLDDMPLISRVAGDVLYRAFGTPPEAGRRHYLATTGLPFEAQLAQLYPDSPPQLREQTARIFHARKVQEAYAHARLFPEVPKMVKRLDQEHWTLVVSTGAEREVAELLLEREGIRIWFEAVLGSGQGTKREHLEEYRRRYPAVPIFLVGDSRFDLEAATDLEVPMLARSASYPGWTLTPEVFREWGAKWADPSLASLPDALADLERGPRTTRPRQPPARRSRPARRGSPPPRRRAARPGRAR